MQWGYGWGMNWMMAGWWLAWILATGAVVWVVARSAAAHVPERQESPETILKRRYARGELSREQYEQRLADLRQ